VTLTVAPRSFQCWDPGSKAWKQIAGRWNAEAGFSAGEIRAHLRFDVEV
jgi:beta-glucosidase